MLSSRWVAGSTIALFVCLIAAGCGGGSEWSEAKPIKVPNKPPYIVKGSLNWEPDHPLVVPGIPYDFSVKAVDPDISDRVVMYWWKFAGDEEFTATTAPTIRYTFDSSSNGKVVVKATDNRGATGPEEELDVPLAQDVPPLLLSDILPNQPLDVQLDFGGSRRIIFEFSLDAVSSGTGQTEEVQIDFFGFATHVDTIFSDPKRINSDLPARYQFSAVYLGESHPITQIDQPTLRIEDDNGRTSREVAFAPITLRTINTLNSAPTVAIAEPVLPGQGVANSSEPFALSFWITDNDNDYVIWQVEWGDGTIQEGFATETANGALVTLEHQYSGGLIGTSLVVKITVDDGRIENSSATRTFPLQIQ